LNVGRDYVDATVFGEVNKTYLSGMTTYDLETVEPVPEEGSLMTFDYHAAQELYGDDPVAMTILNRMRDMEATRTQRDRAMNEVEALRKEVELLRRELSYANNTYLDARLVDNSLIQSKHYWDEKQSQKMFEQIRKIAQPSPYIAEMSADEGASTAEQAFKDYVKKSDAEKPQWQGAKPEKRRDWRRFGR
jgi:hypothetical protein